MTEKQQEIGVHGSVASLASKPLPTISAHEFAGRFARGVREHQQSFTWFLGAGCSISSGIMDAGGLVDKWLLELHELQDSSEQSFEAWRQNKFPTYDPNNRAMLYASAFESRHPFPADRQREIEMICAKGEPGYGYATLAQLLSHAEYGRFCNTVLTTNFDDQIADALYLYGERHARPLVITHESLARYVRTSSPRPIIVKLHGDAHLDPKNLQPETREIDASVREPLYPFLQNHALVFIGYGGNDESILKFVLNCPMRGIYPPIYWVSKADPPPPYSAWLSERGALRVDHKDFDQLMHLIRGALRIELLERTRWDRIGDAYYRDFTKLAELIEGTQVPLEDANALKSATQVAEETLPEEWKLGRRARAMERIDLNAAEQLYTEGIKRFPNSVPARIFYAYFLQALRREADKAEKIYRQALEMEPDNAFALTAFASFSYIIRKDIKTAEHYFQLAIKNGPTSSAVFSAYAIFLSHTRREPRLVEEQFKYTLALAAFNENATANYAQFLLSEGREDGLALLHDLLAHLGDKPIGGLNIETAIYLYAHDRANRSIALGMLKKALVARFRTETWDYSITIERAKKDSHPNVPLLIELARVARAESDINNLDKFSDWTNATVGLALNLDRGTPRLPRV
jgi:Tfp pilus assembly protein PilF